MKITDKGLVVDYENEEGVIPFSQIDEESDVMEDSEKGETGTLVIPEWLAKVRGWL
jgi:hypothetical protein